MIEATTATKRMTGKEVPCGITVQMRVSERERRGVEKSVRGCKTEKMTRDGGRGRWEEIGTRKLGKMGEDLTYVTLSERKFGFQILLRETGMS
jgi:hypothetical protein